MCTCMALLLALLECIAGIRRRSQKSVFCQKLSSGLTPFLWTVDVHNISTQFLAFREIFNFEHYFRFN